MGGVTPKGTTPAGMHDKSKRPVGHENLHRTKATEESERVSLLQAFPSGQMDSSACRQIGRCHSISTMATLTSVSMKYVLAMK